MRTVLSALLLTAAATSASAQTFEQRAQAERRQDFAYRPAIAGWSARGALSREWAIETYYVDWDQARPARPVYVARRVAGDLKGVKATLWTTSATCPALADRLGAMQALQAPGVSIPGMSEMRDLSVIADGVGYRLWARFGTYPGSSASGDVEMTGNVDSPVAAWAATTEAALKACWTPTKPLR